MANENRAPIADLVAIIQEPDREGNPKDVFVTLCPLWASQSGNGNLSGTMSVQPVQWSSPKTPRRIVIQFRSRN